MSLIKVSLDFETRSAVNIKTEGLYRYMAHPTTKALLATYKINGGEKRRWRYHQPCPDDLREAIESGGMFSAHNAAFERLLMQRVLVKEGWPAPDITQFRCTAATAAAMALPRALGNLAEALDLEVQKDKEGTRLINLFSKPRKARKGEDPTLIYFNEPWEFPDDFERFHDYCDIDVDVEDAADEKMASLPDEEQRFYVLQERINDRGMRVDMPSINAAIDLADRSVAKYNAALKAVTGNAVGTVNQVDALVKWVESRGVSLDSATKADIDEALGFDDLPGDVRTALELRRDGGKSSVSKLKKMKSRAVGDRVYGSFVYHSASTGRTQSVGVNFNNLPRPRKLFDDSHLDTKVLFEAIRMRDPEWLEALYGPVLGSPMHLLSDAIRGFIWAAPGKELIQADYSGIEGMVIAWSSEEQWKLREMFAILEDPDNRPDLYRQTAASILNLTTDIVTKKHWARQAVGKVSELALGFGGGVAAFHSMSKNYNVKLDPLFEPVWGSADEETRAKAVKRYESNLKRGKEKTDELSKEAWIACEIIKVGWRKSNPAIQAGWHAREAAVRDAIRNPGQIFEWNCLKFTVKMGFLWCMLPSGRCLAYASPHLRDQVWAEIKLDSGWADAEVFDRQEAEMLERQGLCRIMGITSPSIRALGVGKTGRMQKEHLYGGKLAENDTQAIARDLLVNGMWKAEENGYPIILTVYDEMVAEVPRGFGDLKQFEKLICELPEWASGMPLTAGGWRGKRYRKD